MNSRDQFMYERSQRYLQKFQSAYQFLNNEQKKIVDSIDGPLMVVAGPGAGKTQVMSLRAANILMKTDVLPESILCLTFTDSATKNLQKRLHRFIGNAAYDVSAFTFHGFASHLVDEFREFFYDESDNNIVEELDQVLLFEKIFEGLGLDSDLRKKDMDGRFLYMRDVIFKISQLKRAGIDPKKFMDNVTLSMAEIEYMQAEVGGFVDSMGRVTKKSIEMILGFFHELQMKLGEISKGSWTDMFVGELAEMILSLQEEDSTKPFTKWKNKFLTKDEHKKSVLKDLVRLKKNLELGIVYQKYDEEMKEKSYVDFDDLLMSIREKLASDQGFLASVQERYLYIMVDEFQDTSGVQMDIVRMILDSDFFAGNPNIMVVGDDDQSIYKFQGAKVSNILQFKNFYPATELVVLDVNYRSNQRILDLIRAVVVQGEDRLENHIDTLTKVLKSGNAKVDGGLIAYKEFAYEVQELEWICDDIKSKWLAGEDLSEIAVIARNHNTLRQLSDLMNQAGVPLVYEHSKDILQSDIIRKIHKILAFVDLEYDKNHFAADDLLVDILCFDFWKLPRLDVWKLVRLAFDRKLRIADLIREEGVVEINVKRVVEFLFILGQKAQESSVFDVLEFLLGKELKKLDEGLADWVCPLKEYYFSKDKEGIVSSSYIEFLMDLKTLFDRLKDYKVGKTLFTKDVVDYLDAHIDHGLRINNNFNLASTKKAVTLLTAHKSKGMEFETVYVLSCNDDKWASKGRPDKLQLLNHISVQSDPDENDDFLRLFYVALSRAKRNLILSNFTQKSNGREVKGFRFLETVLDEESLFDEISLATENSHGISEQSVELDIGFMLGGAENDLEAVELSLDERNFLLGLVEDFKLSVTAFNNFLDLTKGGPKYFLETNLLRFPKGKNAKAEYGTAMHEAISNFINFSKKQKDFAGEAKLQELYVESLQNARMTKKEKKEYFVYGWKFLKKFYDSVVVKGGLDLDDLTELNFAKENIVIESEGGDVALTGAIDWIHFEKDKGEILGMKVLDFKTGKVLSAWDKNVDEKSKMKAWGYRNQLAFYDFLLSKHRKLKNFELIESGLYFLESTQENPVLSAKLSSGELLKIQKLVGIVFHKIKNLDFPDVSGYENNYMGTMDFIEDLIEGKV